MNYRSLVLKNKVVVNSLWSISANIIQNIILSIFFILIARYYSTLDFSNYIIANTIYSLVAGFSSLGMGHWFIREYVESVDKDLLGRKFFYMQFYLGIFFFLINIILSFFLYESVSIRILSALLGVNIIFDNLIYVVKSINIAESLQKKSFLLLLIEAALKLITSLLVYVFNIDILILCLLLIIIRIITFYLFIQFGNINFLKSNLLIRFKINEFKKIILSNWSFVIISSIAIVNWRIGNVLVSKFLPIENVADYEISYKLLSIFYLVPVMFTTSLYPILIKNKEINYDKMKAIYQIVFILLCIYGFLSFTFIYSYSDIIIPYLFGDKYSFTHKYCSEMFLVMLIFPTIFLQANILLTLRQEKYDMLCNIISLLMNILISVIGLYKFKSLTVINFSIFTSFLFFHVMQDYMLIKKKIITLSHVLRFYSYTFISLIAYQLLSSVFKKEFVFIVFWIVLLLIFIINKKNINLLKLVFEKY